MGSGAAASSIERVLEAHGKELHEEPWENLPEAVKALKPRLELEGAIDEIERGLVFAAPEGEAEGRQKRLTARDRWSESHRCAKVVIRSARVQEDA